jgi:integrase
VNNVVAQNLEVQMNIVEPIKSIEDIQNIKRILSKKPRNALLFSFGINSGLRIADILSLDVKDVKGKDYIELREKKTNKYKKFPINENLKVEIEGFVKDKSDDIPLFYTQKHYRLDRVQAYRIINKAARMVGIKGRIGTHTLRKTFGYHFYQQYDDIVMLQKIFNHSTPSITLRYIGIEQEDIDEVYRNFYL